MTEKEINRAMTSISYNLLCKHDYGVHDRYRLYKLFKKVLLKISEKGTIDEKDPVAESSKYGTPHVLYLLKEMKFLEFKGRGKYATTEKVSELLENGIMDRLIKKGRRERWDDIKAGCIIYGMIIIFFLSILIGIIFGGKSASYDDRDWGEYMMDRA